MRATLRHDIIFAVMIFCVMTAFSSCVKEDNEPNTGLGIGDKVPRFSVTLDTGETVSDVSLAGKVAVIEFFNTTCPDCRASFPTLQDLYVSFNDNPEVAILAIAREESADDIKDYWGKNGLTIPFSPQTDRNVYNLFASTGIPRIFIISPGGVITATYGPDNIPPLSTLISDVETSKNQTYH